MIHDVMPAFGTETVSLAQSSGRVLRQDIFAERDQPPFDRVTMDGIAIRYSSLASGNTKFAIQARQHAGDPRTTLGDDAACIEIMTGAALPANTDCVVPVERIAVDNGIASIDADYQATSGQFVHTRASDYARGSRLLDAGHRIAPADIAVIASCGLDRVEVGALPAIRVISTGNELIAAGQPIEDHQIRLSNGPALMALLAASGYTDCAHDHLPDDRQLLRQRLAEHLGETSVLVVSGGVSMGKADFVPEVLRELGVSLVFHRISQRPGKPMWFGIGPQQQAVFALPGNPVSTLVCCRQYVLPALAQATGAAAPDGCNAALAEPFAFDPRLTCFLPVAVSTDDAGRLLATPVPTNTSGDFAALSATDGYLELPLELDEFAAGSSWPLHLWRPW